jgi:hypothetical protein
MKRISRKDAIYTVGIVLLAATLACNLSTPRGPVEPTSEAAQIVPTATGPQSAETSISGENDATSIPDVQSSPTSSSPSDGSSTESEGSGNGSSPGVAGGDTVVSPTGDIFTSVSIKDGNTSFEGNIAFPGINTSDDIDVKPVGFASAEDTGSLVFTLECNGRGKAKVNYKGGAVRSGSPGCGETWTVFVINGSPDSQIKLHLDATGNVDWKMTVTGGK